MPSAKVLKSAQYIELGSYQYWPVLVPRGIRLYTYEQVPGFLRENPYITDGYRAYLTSRLCIKSLFILSNETVNIWSHLLGFFLFFTLGVYDLLAVLPMLDASREDYVIYSIGLFCFQVCMLCSVGYHLFCCHRSEKTSRRWMALDYAGISIGIICCYVPGVFYAFYCNNRKRRSDNVPLELRRYSDLSQHIQEPQNVLAAGVPGNCSGHDVGSVLCPDTPSLLDQEVAEASLSYILCCGGIWPNSHLSLDLAQWGFQLRHSPGQLNYLGFSHQVWHILVVLMFYWWHQSALFITNYRHSYPYPDYPLHS
uniref:Progestin and adipoQ receptor family member IIIa n=1 Tax=Cyprinus carpio carpio TaxID=630221 RepID=A0A8C1FFT8_CYPCA